MTRPGRAALGPDMNGGLDKTKSSTDLPDRMSGEVEFDRIAPVYDETRQPPSEQELEALVGLLNGCRTVLDAGVGPGDLPFRYAPTDSRSWASTSPSA